MKQLVTFEVQDGENEYRDYGIYDHKYSDEEIIKHFYGLDNLDEENGWYWKDTSVVRINNAEDIARQEIEVVGCDDWKIGSHADFDVVAVEEVK